MSGWMVWVVDCYTAFFFTLFVVGTIAAFSGMMFISSDLIDDDFGLESKPKKKTSGKREFVNKISIILMLCGAIAVTIVIFAPSREAFIYMMNIDSEQLRQIYDITIKHYR